MIFYLTKSLDINPNYPEAQNNLGVALKAKGDLEGAISSFKKADKIVLCPVYTAGEKLKLDFNYAKFAKSISKNSRVSVFMIKGENQLSQYVKQNIYGKKIVIGMGAGSISNWIRNLPNKI